MRPGHYTNIHSKIRRRFGTPSVCEDCKGLFSGRFIHWANVSGEYKEDRSDWKRLCAKCHKNRDFSNITISV